MKKSKIALLIIVFLLIILSIFVVIKINQYNTIINISNTNIEKKDSKNFYYEVNNLTENSTFKIWINDSKIKFQSFTNNNLTQTTYVDLTNNSSCIVNEENKTYSLLENQILVQPNYINSPNILDIAIGIKELSFIDKISFAFSIKSINSEILNNTETIKVTLKIDDVIETTWFDSTTLYPIKSESTINNSTTYNLTDCNLSNEELIFTNTENYNQI